MQKVRCRLSEFLRDRGLNQMDVVRATKLSPTTVGQLTRNEFRRLDCKAIVAVCGYFEVGIGEMFPIVDVEERE